MKAGEARGAGPAAAQVTTLTAAGGAKVAVVDGDARNSTRADGAPLPLPEVAPDVSIPRRARNRYVATGRCSRPRPRQRTTLLGLSGRTGRSRARTPATPCGMSSGRSPQRRSALTCTAVNDGDYGPTLFGTATPFLALHLATRARLEGQPRALPHPKRLQGRARSTTGFTPCSSESEDSISL
jgi:hypothetical protein